MKNLLVLILRPLTLRAFTLAMLVALNGCSMFNSGEKKIMKAELNAFGKLPDGTDVKVYTLSNTKGMRAKLTDYGAILTELWVPDRNGRFGNVVLGFNNAEQYVKGHPYLARPRAAWRIASRKASSPSMGRNTPSR
mgnify:CR=1 FL=1